MGKEGWARVPWSSDLSFKDKAKKVGIQYQNFVEQLRESKTDQELAEEFNVDQETIFRLRKEFERFGLDSVHGQD